MSTASRLQKAPEFRHAQIIDLKGDARFNEDWLERLICDSPEILGLGPVTVLDKQRRQKDGIGRLDVVLEAMDKTAVFVVELMLGPVDSTHIVRTIDYWLDTQKKLRKNVECKAVLVGERIVDSRFGEVVKFLTKSMPLVVKEVAALQIGDVMTLHFTTIFRNSDLEEETEESEVTLVDRDFWIRKDEQTLSVAEALIPLLKDLNPVISPNLTRGYINVRVGNRAEGFIGFRPVRGNVRISVKVENALPWRKRLGRSGLSVIQTDKADNKVRLLVTEKDVSKNKALLKDLLSAGYDYWFG